jgi:hypothetical protein
MQNRKQVQGAFALAEVTVVLAIMVFLRVIGR